MVYYYNIKPINYNFKTMEITEEILELVKKKMYEQGAYNRDAYAELVDETIEYFEEKGKLTDDDNIEFLKDQLMGMWEFVQDEFAAEEA